MQTILGANGVIGKQVAKALTVYTTNIRLVSRNPQRVNSTDTLLTADLLDFDQTCKAVEGSDVVYLTIGLKYKTEVWQKDWPVIMRNVLNACIKYNAKLVFFDNVYLYGLVGGWMTEQTTVAPISRKGEIRADLDAMIMNEVKQGRLNALIARSADFYGPDTPNSFITYLILDKLKKNKTPQWIANDKVRHSLTYTPDAGRATAMLGNTEWAYNQVWHLPTHRLAISGAEFIEMAIKEYGAKQRHTVLLPWMMELASLFNPLVRESIEMMYQYQYNYLFDSAKFEKAFDFNPTTYADGVKQTIAWLKKQ